MKLLLTLSIILLAPCLAQESEPNDTIPTADPLALNGQIINAALSPRSDLDFWSFQMPSDGFVDLTLGQTSGSGSSLAQIAGLLQAANGTELIDFIVLNGRLASSTARVGLPRTDENGLVITYVLQVGVAQFGSAQSYTLSGRFTADAFYEREPNNQSQDSQIIELGETYEGVTNNADDNDWFAFGLERDADVRISLRKDVQGAQAGVGHTFTLFSADIGNVPVRQNVLGSSDFEALILEGLPARDENGDQIAYFLQITRSSAVPAPQTYQLTVTADAVDFFETVPNGSIATANPLFMLNGQSYEGRIAPRGDRDIFSFQLAEDGEVTITLGKEFLVSSNLSRFEVEIFADSNLSNRITSFLVRGDRLSNSTTLNLSRFQSNGRTEETYFIVVTEGTSFTENLNEYSLSVVGPGEIEELRIRSASRSPDGSFFNIVFDSIAGTQYTIESSVNLSNWNFLRTIEGAPGQTTVELEIGNERNFFRITR